MIKHVNISEKILNYIRDVSLRDTQILKDLRNVTNKLPERNMQILPEQGQFLYLLTKLIQAKKAIEIGVFTGYSALCIASALPRNGRLIACDNNAEWTAIARRYWEKAGLSKRIHLHLNDALVTLDNLLSNSEENTYDMIFIDADKVNYFNYYEKSLKLVKSGGLIILDNMLWSGHVADSTISDIETNAIRQMNEFLFEDERVDISLLPFADGLTLAYKR